jgi:hypothetical protein
LPNLSPSHPDRPLIICDVDEVALHFIAHFEELLAREGCRLDATSFRLDGNIYHLKEERHLSPEETKALIKQLFQEISDYQRPVEKAVVSLTALQEISDLVFLTNFPEKLIEKRKARLAELGLIAPVYSNKGSKSEAIASLIKERQGLSFFIDDSPGHIKGALGLPTPPICLQFVADRRYASLTSHKPIRETCFLTRDWAVVEHYIRGRIQQDQTHKT